MNSLDFIKHGHSVVGAQGGMAFSNATFKLSEPLYFI